MANYLKINYEETPEMTTIIDNYENRNKPFANSPVYEAFIQDIQTLTQGDDVKRVYQLQLVVKDIKFEFCPGDVIGILPENDEKEVEKLLLRLNLEEICHSKYSLQVQKGTTKKKVIPKHLPSCATLYDVFLKYIDIRTVPKKTFLKSLLNFVNDPAEKEKLEFICSPAGSDEYHKLLTKNRSLLSLLNSFPSCHPPIELILEQSTPLNPRYFSLASSPLSNDISIVFYVLTLENGMKGICTGWLEKLIKNEEFKTKIPIYFRKPGQFHFDNISSPTILIATGTGLAPFLSFLEHKSLIHQSSVDSTQTWLFYGCRYSTRDFLCQNLLKSYLSKGVLTRLHTSFSRESIKKEYVQDRIVEYKHEVVDLILNRGGSIFLCGDIKTVIKDVKETIVTCFMECKDVERTHAEDILNDLIKNGRFLVDSWT